MEDNGDLSFWDKQCIWNCDLCAWARAQKRWMALPQVRSKMVTKTSGSIRISLDTVQPLFELPCFFPTCQVRVVRFYLSCLLLVLLLPPASSSSCLLLPPPRPPPPAQLRPSTRSVLCRTSTTTIHAQCSLPDLNHDHPRPVFPAGPQPRPSPPSVPFRTSTTTIHAQCSLPDLNREYPRQVFPAGPHVGRYAR